MVPGGSKAWQIRPIPTACLLPKADGREARIPGIHGCRVCGCRLLLAHEPRRRTRSDVSLSVVLNSTITSDLQLAAAPGNVRIAARSSGLSKPSVVNVSQIATMDKIFLRDRIRSLDAQTMRLIDEGPRLVLDL